MSEGFHKFQTIVLHLILGIFLGSGWESIGFAKTQFKSGQLINHEAWYFIDSDNLSLEEIISRRSELFVKQKENPISLGFIKDTVWILLEMESMPVEQLAFEASFPLTDHIDFYQFNENFELQYHAVGGDKYPFNARALPYRKPIFKPVMSDEKAFFLFQFRNVGPVITAVKIWNYDDFLNYAFVDYILISLCLGCIIINGLFNLILYFTTKDKAYFYYVVYHSFLISLSASIQGIGIHFDPTRNEQSWLLNQGAFIAIDLCIMFSGLFAWHFLNMKTQMPTVGKIVLAIAAFCLFNLLGHIIIGNNAFFKSTSHLTSILMPIVLLFAGILAIGRKYRPAYYYLVGWSFLLVGQLNTTLGLVGILEFNDWTLWSYLLGATIEGTCISMALGARINLIRQKREEEANAKNHYFHQMEKVFHTHQLLMMQDGKNLEDTMPTGKSEICAIAFDIADSSIIGHSINHKFFANVLQKCHDLMNQNYDPLALTANAYRIKEMGDGFLCSIGFPFQPLGKVSIESAAYQLALGFIEIFQHEAQAYFGQNFHTCGIGIAKGTVEGHFPSSGLKEYNLYGDSIVQATRYEAMRKLILEHSEKPNIIILQESVYHGLTVYEKSQFTELNLPEANLQVRDDPNARKLYYQVFSTNQNQVA